MSLWKSACWGTLSMQRAGSEAGFKDQGHSAAFLHDLVAQVADAEGTERTPQICRSGTCRCSLTSRVI